MNNHLIIGNGNLGAALKAQATKLGDTSTILSQSSGFKYPKDLPKDFLKGYTHVWCAVGAGSVEGAKENIEPFIDLHVRLPARLLQLKDYGQKLVLFSTDYVLEDYRGKVKPMSGYTQSKIMMEQWYSTYGMQNDYCFRVGSLYGTQKPNFVTKFLKRWAAGEEDVVSNPCHPTPSDWLAALLHDLVRYPSEGIFDAIPSGQTTNYDWAKLILKTLGRDDEAIRVKPKAMDESRPEAFKKMPRSITSWDHLWKKHGLRVCEKWAK